MNPGVAEFHALCAHPNVGGSELDLIQMLAFLSHLQLSHCHSEPAFFAGEESAVSFSLAPCDPTPPGSPQHHKYSAGSRAPPHVASQRGAHRHTSTETPSSPDDKKPLPALLFARQSPRAQALHRRRTPHL